MFRKRLVFTLLAWPAVAAATIAVCLLTKTMAGWIGIDLPDQQSVGLLRNFLERAFASLEAFVDAAFLVAQVAVLMPAVEEAVFRWLLFRLPQRLTERMTRGTRGRSVARLFDCSIVCLSSALFSAAHYVFQPWPDAAFLALFLFGVAQCWLYRRTGRIWCAMLNHALFNLTNLALLLVLPEAT